MIDLDELERKRAAAERQIARRIDGVNYLFEADVEAYIAALRNAAPELIAMARRYQLLRRGQRWSVINGIGDVLRAETLDAAIDAAMKEKP